MDPKPRAVKSAEIFGKKHCLPHIFLGLVDLHNNSPKINNNIFTKFISDVFETLLNSRSGILEFRIHDPDPVNSKPDLKHCVMPVFSVKQVVVNQ